MRETRMTKHKLTALAILGMLAVGAPRARAAVRLVDDDNLECFNAPHRTINEALRASLPGDQIIVCPGIYAEQVVLPFDIILLGMQSGTRRAVIRPPSLPQTRVSIMSGNPVAAAVIVEAG